VFKLGRFSMPETLLFLTELLGLPVFDLKGRRIGRVRDSAVVPLVDPFRVDRYLIGAGSPAPQLPLGSWKFAAIVTRVPMKAALPALPSGSPPRRWTLC